MASILGIVAYPTLPAKMGGQKGIHLFYSALATIIKTQLVGSICNEKIDTTYRQISFFTQHPSKYINPFIAFKLLQIIKQKNPDVIIFEHPYLLIHQLIVKWFAHKKIIVHSHNIEFLRFKSLQKKWWWVLKIGEGISYKNAHKVFFISKEDQEFAIQQWHLKKEKTMVVPYGIDIDFSGPLKEKNKAKNDICNMLDIDSNTTLFFFNGTLNYAPNRMALEDMKKELFPLLAKKESPKKYALIVTGTQANEELKNFVDNMSIPVFLLGFVDDISIYYKGCDVFLNLVKTGGGIKTKLVEALGYGMNAVSYEEGAWGIDKNCVQEKLFCSNDIEKIASSIVHFEQQPFSPTPTEFYQQYAWKNIALKVKKEIEILEGN